jgi:anti-anti-sigma factor
LSDDADSVRIEPIEGGLRVAGQIDLSTVDRFRSAVEGAVPGSERLVIDLTGCSYMGSEGIGVLVRALQELGSGRLVLRSPTRVVRKVLDLAGLARLPNVEITQD